MLHISITPMLTSSVRHSNTEGVTIMGEGMDKQIHTSNKETDMSKTLGTHTPSKRPLPTHHSRLPLSNHTAVDNSRQRDTIMDMAKGKQREVALMVSSFDKTLNKVSGNNLSVGGNDVEMTPMNGQNGAYGAPANRDPNAILNECREIDKGIDAIQRNLERLRFLQQRAIDDPDASQGTQTNRELDALSSDTMTLYRNFASRITAIKSKKESGEPRNKPQVGLVDRKLKTAINEYQQVDRDFRHKLSAQMERQYRIVRPDASEQEVREAIEDTSNQQVFSQAVCKPNALYLYTSTDACNSYSLRIDEVNHSLHYELSKVAMKPSKR